MIRGVIDDLFEGAPVGLGVHGPDGRWLRVNRELAALNRKRTDELIGQHPVAVHGELGEPIMDAIRHVQATGRPRWSEIRAPLPGASGERTFDVAYFPLGENVGIAAIETTERRRAEEALAEAHRRDALMARAGHLLSTALNLQETADLVARLVVPELADWCFVELVQPDGSIERTAVAHGDPEKERWAREIIRRYPLDPASPVGSPKVIRTGESELIEELPDAVLVQAAVDEEHLRLLRAVGFVSVCIVPLFARGRVIGDLAFATGPSDEDRPAPPRRFGPETLAVARALAERCALALDNAALYAQRDLVAVSLQEELLPRELPAVPGLDVAARYSAAGEGNDVGGDFYDLFASGGGWQLVVGDVVGKGPAAAAVTGLARHTLRAAAAYEQRPTQLLRGLNRALLAEDPGRRLATVACVRLDAADGALRLTVGVGGHPLPLLVSADGAVREVGAYGTLLGVHEAIEVTDVPVRLEPGELLVLYTDGVIDARGPGGLFGEERLTAMLTGMTGEAPSRVVHRIENAVLAHSGGRPRDDVAIIALRLRPPAG